MEYVILGLVVLVVILLIIVLLNIKKNKENDISLSKVEGDIIREIADNVNTLRKLLRQVHPQKIALHQPGGKPGKILVQVNDAFGIDLGAVKRYIFSLKQETGRGTKENRWVI